MTKSIPIIFFISNLFLTTASFGSSSYSSSSCTNFGERAFHEKQREELLSGRIERMTVVLEPLFKNETKSDLKNLFRLLVHPKFSSKKLYHAAAILYLDNLNEVLVEYGNYIGEEKKGFFSYLPLASIKQRRDKRNYTNKYHYLNEDGLRFIKLEKEESGKKFISDLISNNAVYCDVLVANKTLGNLLNNFKEGWRAKDYFLGSHDCQAFVVQLIYQLKAVRINDISRLRTAEKFMLTNDMMNAFYENEHDINNFIGRIPIFGLAYDIAQYSILYYERINMYDKTKNKLKSYCSKVKRFFSKSIFYSD